MSKLNSSAHETLQLVTPKEELEPWNILEPPRDIHWRHAKQNLKCKLEPVPNPSGTLTFTHLKSYLFCCMKWWSYSIGMWHLNPNESMWYPWLVPMTHTNGESLGQTPDSTRNRLAAMPNMLQWSANPHRDNSCKVMIMMIISGDNGDDNQWSQSCVHGTVQIGSHSYDSLMIVCCNLLD